MTQVSEAAAPPLGGETARPGRRTYHNGLALILGIAIFASLSFWCAVKSKGFLEADAMTHYMFARHSFREWSYLVNVWGRPLCTGAYAIPAYLGGVVGARAMSLAMAVVMGLVVYRVAKNQKFRMPAIAAILLFAQPLFFAHSFSELTEIPFSLVAILAFWAYQTRRWLAMTIFVSLSITGRPEGLGLMFFAAIALLAHGRWKYLFLMPVPCLVWSFLGAVSWGDVRWWPYSNAWWTWLPRNWPYAAKSAYGSGQWYYFIGILPVILSPLMFPFLFTGIWRCLVDWRLGARLRRFGFERVGRCFTAGIDDPPLDEHRRWCALAMTAIPVSVLVVHTFLWTFGLMASSGEPRYLVSVAPFWALVVGRGWEWAWERFRLPAPFLIAGLFATTPIFANRYYQVVPLRLYNNDLMGRAVAEWYRKTPGLERDYPRVMATNPAVYYFLDLSQSDPQRGESWQQKNVIAHRPGTILIWDPVFGTSNASRDMIMAKEEIERAGWLWIGNVVFGDAWCNVYLSPQNASAAATRDDEYQTPGDVTLWE
jgi:hypothetical protein